MAAEKIYTPLKVTNVFIDTKVSGHSVLAKANIVLNDQIILRGMKVRDSSNGLYVSMPVDRLSSEEKNFFNPITRALREHIEQTVLEAYVAQRGNTNEKHS